MNDEPAFPDDGRCVVCGKKITTVTRYAEAGAGIDTPLYILFAGEDYYPRGGIQDKLEHTYGRSEDSLSRLIERARGYCATSDFFYHGMPDAKMVGVDYQHIDWWHIVEFSSRGIVIVARGHGGGDEPWEEDLTEEEV